MSVVKSLRLLFLKREIYLPNSAIEGQVALTLRSSLVNPLVKVELVGRSYLEWKVEGNANMDYSKDVLCSNKTDHVHKSKTFEIEDNWLGAGSHTFDFSFQLPSKIPSTFKSKIGHVFYFIQTSCSGREHILAKQREYLPVQGTSGYYHDSVNKHPILVEENKNLYYNCFRQGLIYLRVSLDHNIFIPGECVILSAEIENWTNKYLRSMSCTLNSYVTYEGFTLRAERKTLEEKQELLSQEAHINIIPFSTATVINALSLPTLLPVSTEPPGGEIMEFKYEVAATVHIPWSLKKVVAKVPIVIQCPRVARLGN
ncbi:arrestin domain-containing protein 5 [Tachyglossus aculeatus]|uniref:arrestin domain-containing protein 5 n=1 Tax=Tachyglossus aculeatus TaxID=9261 RepID=UPI0018F327B9|nr:arrestin domain-containing protein 5 [Tachyglossus aculeatus]